MLCKCRKRIFRTVIIWAISCAVLVFVHAIINSINAQDALNIDTEAVVQNTIEYTKKPTPEDAKAWAETSAYGILICLFWILVGVVGFGGFSLLGLVVQYLWIIKSKMAKIEHHMATKEDIRDMATKDDVSKLGEICGHSLDRSHDIAVMLAKINQDKKNG